MKLKLSFVAVLALLLSACVTQAVKKPPMIDAATAEQRQLARESALRVQDAWSLNGRVALSNGRNGGSGRIEWKQDGTKSEVALSAPVTRQSWRLTVDGGQARIDGLEGGPRTGTDAGALLRETAGWVIPLASLGDWVRGVRAKKPTPTDVAYDAQGRLSRLVQGGWTIDYRWPEGAITPATLPVRVDAAKGEAKVKLVVDEWQGGPTVLMMDADVDVSATAQLRRALSALNLRDPTVDLHKALAAGDPRPVGVCGFACRAPGFEGDPQVELRLLEGTGDVVEGREHLELIEQANAYARAYNSALSAWLRQHPQATAVLSEGN